MKKRILALIMALSVAVLSGCSASFTDGGNMMRPPRPTGDKAEIQNIIEEKAGSGFIFVYPQTGDYRSAVTMHIKERTEHGTLFLQCKCTILRSALCTGVM